MQFLYKFLTMGRIFGSNKFVVKAFSDFPECTVNKSGCTADTLDLVFFRLKL